MNRKDLSHNESCTELIYHMSSIRYGKEHCLCHTQIATFMGPTCGPPGSCRPQMGPMLAPWTLLSGYVSGYRASCQHNIKAVLTRVKETFRVHPRTEHVHWDLRGFPMQVPPHSEHWPCITPHSRWLHWQERSCSSQVGHMDFLTKGACQHYDHCWDYNLGARQFQEGFSVCAQPMSDVVTK